MCLCLFKHSNFCSECWKLSMLRGPARFQNFSRNSRLWRSQVVSFPWVFSFPTYCKVFATYLKSYWKPCWPSSAVLWLTVNRASTFCMLYLNRSRVVVQNKSQGVNFVTFYYLINWQNNGKFIMNQKVLYY